jgi:glycosyltransferase involved in cell wall biosynthesis
MPSHQAKGKILIVLGTLYVGGTESQVALLAEGLTRRGWSVEIYLLEKAGSLVGGLEAAGIPVIDGGHRSADRCTVRRWSKLIASEARLFRRIIRFRPDVVHCFLPLTNFMGALAGRLGFVTVMTSRRALGNHQDRRPAWKWIDRVANGFSDVVTANSRAVAEDTAMRDGYDASKIVVIANGLDFSKFDNVRGDRSETRSALGLSSEHVAIVMVANLIPYKGHRDLIEAFARVAGSDPRLRLFLVGTDRGIASELLGNAGRLGVADRVQFLGPRNDIPGLLSAMDLGVMSSHEEGFSNALLEKLAAGLPVVATDVGGNPEALENMPNCVLVKPQNPEDLARGLALAIGRLGADEPNRAIRRRLVRERYSVDAMVDAYERLYARLSPSSAA